jgi:hypothetical protein
MISSTTPQRISGFPSRPVERTDRFGLRQRNTFTICVMMTALRQAVVTCR